MKLDPFIEAEKIAGHSVQKTCCLFEVSRAAYYQRRNGEPSVRAVTDAELTRQITEAGEPEGGPFHPLDQVVDCLGGPVGHVGAVPGSDLVLPADQGATE
jgi:hypothetical protein